jgi:hypothetical protein
VQLTADALASNHTNKHIKNVKEKKKRVVHQAMPRLAEVLLVEDPPEEKVQDVASRVLKFEKE